jgi:hypothetical protein
MGMAFAEAAHDYTAHGLTVFPCGGADGKSPLIKHWRRVGRRAVDELIAKFPEANVGLIDGPIVRVDVDDPLLIEDATGWFGDTPIKVGTPSGGVHLWYASRGEPRQTKIHGLPIDILGRGGFGVAPPSIVEGRGEYVFMEGSLDDIERLPYMRSDMLLKQPAANSNVAMLHTMVDGSGRNNELWKRAMRAARGAENEHHLRLILNGFNNEFLEPLGEGELDRIAQSAWGYQTTGRNRYGGPPTFNLDIATLEEFSVCPDALFIWGKLHIAHWWRHGGKFQLTKALAISLGWDKRRFNKAVDFLVEHGCLEIVRHGRSGSRQPRLARLQPQRIR